MGHFLKKSCFDRNNLLVLLMVEQDLERRHMLETMEAQEKLHYSVENCCRDVVGGTVEGCIQIP